MQTVKVVVLAQVLLFMLRLILLLLLPLVLLIVAVVVQLPVLTVDVGVTVVEHKVSARKGKVAILLFEMLSLSFQV